jgi:hypothetical protein
MKTTPLVIVILLLILVNTLNAQTKYNEKDQQRYAERIAIAQTLEKYEKQAYTINDILKDVAFIRYKRWEESDIAKEKHSLEQKQNKDIASKITKALLGGEKYDIEQETKKNLTECQKQLESIFRFYQNIPVKDLAKEAKRIESQIPKAGINDNIKIDSETAIMLTFDFIKEFCRKEAAKLPRRR